jgi:hypothetical protein
MDAPLETALMLERKQRFSIGMNLSRRGESGVPQVREKRLWCDCSGFRWWPGDDSFPV